MGPVFQVHNLLSDAQPCMRALDEVKHTTMIPLCFTITLTLRVTHTGTITSSIKGISNVNCALFFSRLLIAHVIAKNASCAGHIFLVAEAA